MERNDNYIVPVYPPLKAPWESAIEEWGPKGFEYYFQCIVCDSDKTLKDYYTEEEWEEMKKSHKYKGIS